MLVVYNAYDDNSADIIDVTTMQRYHKNAEQMFKYINKGGKILGVYTTSSKVNYVSAYNIINLPTESEADEYIKDNSLTYQNKKYINNTFYVFEKNNKVIHVNYLIYTQAGNNITYVGKEIKYTPYIQSAKTFNQKEAYATATSMTKNSRTGKYWFVMRLPENKR